MGWEFKESGFKVLLDADVAKVAEFALRPGVEEFLRSHHLTLGDIAYWIAHPGGPKVIQAMEKGLELDNKKLDLSREALSRVGNISSASVLWILNRTLTKFHPELGSYGLMTAMGPAFCAEMVLLRW